MSTEESGAVSSPNWRDPSSYAYTRHLTREAWALEFLERNRTYAALATKLRRFASRICRQSPAPCVIVAPATADALRFCTFSGKPCPLTGCDAVFWRAEINPAVLPVKAQPVSSRSDDAFDVRAFRHPVIVLRVGDETEYVLLSDGLHSIQLEVRRGSVLDGPVRLRYDLAGSVRIEPKLIVLQRLLAMQRLGRFPRSLFPPERRAHRWIVALRALDGSRAGANPREIAATLFGEDTARTDWHSASDYLRSRVRRAVSAGKRLANGGYLSLLSR